ncbi:MAG: ATP synthase F1 subunit delta [Bacteroidota bacterium]
MRYAKPLLEMAQEKGKLDAVKKDMDNFLAICKEERSFALMLRNPIIPHLKKLAVLKKIFSGKVNDLTMAIFEIMTRKNREQVLEDMAKEFIRLYNIHNGIEDAVLKTAIPLDAKLRKEFTKIVEDITKKKVEMQEVVDPELIGGFTLKIGDRKIDDSVSGKLRDLRYTLINN